MSAKQKTPNHHVTFIDGSKAKIRGINKHGKRMTDKNAIEYAERVYGKKVEKIETW